ncbi:MAG: response regulator transcription factor [Candidatus Marinimicrobia bacterium]|nr:response regulator transcription factor [Candidatus Neomarinimicrobiota bacterium]MBL7046635.1 response regulator transcription factor [Candidatus Neomarinimicrobiota bacterium]
MINVLLADDHTMFREGLKQILSDTSDIVVTDEAQNTGEVLNKVSEKQFDVVILDITMPGRTGLDIISELKSREPNLRVLILSMHPEEQYAVRAIKAGAAGYVTKNRAPKELISAIRKISTGKKYLSPAVAEQMAIELENDRRMEPHQKLSDREYQVLCMIASGKTVNKIAEELSLSISTISTNRGRILRKMKMENNAELTYYAVKHGLVD